MNEEKRSSIVTIYNAIQITLWAGVISLSICESYSNNGYHLTLNLLKVAQTLQVVDIIFALLKITPNLIGSFFQVAGRLLITWIFIPSNIEKSILLNIVIPWGVAEIIRYSYYLNISFYEIIPWLRYNAFLLLYPIGITGECRAVEQFKGKWGVNETYLTALQVILVGGMLILYFYMLNQRKKYYLKHSVKSKNN